MEATAFEAVILCAQTVTVTRDTAESNPPLLEALCGSLKDPPATKPLEML